MKKLTGFIAGAFALLLLFLVAVAGIVGSAEESAAAPCMVAGSNGSSTRITPSKRKNARIIIGVGKGLGVLRAGWEIALAAALQESSLVNVDHGTGNSLGLFQETPPSWGTPEQVMDPVYAATAFYNGVSTNPGLLDIKGWQNLPLTVAAQRVERSKYPSRYAKWETQAIQIVDSNADAPAIQPSAAVSQAEDAGFTGAEGDSCTGGSALGASGDAGKVLKFATSRIGVPYAWGGGGKNGKSRGFDQGAGTIGFDCSGLTQYIFWQGAHVSLPRVSGDQYAATRERQVLSNHYDPSKLLPGDLLFWNNHPISSGNIHHVAVYAGNGMMVEAPRTGLKV